MRGIAIATIAAVMACLVSFGCAFKRQPFKGVTGYKDGRVYLTPNRYYAPGVFYSIGELPEGWKRMDTRARTVSFYNATYRSSISTDAWCGANIKDRTLNSLTGDLVTALEDRSFSEEKKSILDGREAIRQQVIGKYQGVPTVIDLVTVRKSDCVFDFYLISQGAAPMGAVEDFESFFGDFRYDIGGASGSGSDKQSR